VEEHALAAVGRGRRGEGVREGAVGLVGLPVDELAADVVLAGQLGDGASRQGVEGELLALRGGERLCGRGGLLRSAAGGGLG
jgi:hypothetical protein